MRTCRVVGPGCLALGSPRGTGCGWQLAGHLCDTQNDVEVKDFNYQNDTRRGWWHCHDYFREIGHSLGLAHEPDTTKNTCMVAGGITKEHLRPHDQNVINNQY